MRRDRKSVVKRERLILLAASIAILAGLTATGIYVKNRNTEKSDEYVVDFSDLEKSDVADERKSDQAGTEEYGDLDYDPYFQETQSSNVENPGLERDGTVSENSLLTGKAGEDGQAAEKETGAQDGATKAENGEEQPETLDSSQLPLTEGVEQADTAAAAPAQSEDAADEAAIAQDAQEDGVEASADAGTLQPALSFAEEDGLIWPAIGNVLIGYSMDKTVYFATLDQYKYNPAMIIGLNEGTEVAAAANGRVVSLYEDSEIGQALVLDLGDGYELTYGQLKGLTVGKGEYVTAGTIIGQVAAPTKYFSAEGSNLYFKMTKDGAPVNPMNRLQAK